MAEIREVYSNSEKTIITLKIMNRLPEWFSPPKDILKKSIEHRTMTFFGAFENEKCIGFAVLKKHNKYSRELYSLGVLKEHQHNGIGHQLIGECVKYCGEKGAIYLTVKTLDSSARYEPYNNTRDFYLKEGFVPLEVFKNYWNKENPCLYLVKYLGDKNENY